jgi:hypothetical protein
MFNQIPRLDAREVHQPENRGKTVCPSDTGEEKAAPNAQTSPQAIEDTGGARAPEFVYCPIRRCRNCQAVGPWKEVSSDVGSAVAPAPSPPPGDGARIGSFPGRSSPSLASKAAQKQEVEQVSQELSAWLRGLKFRLLPDAAVIREISAALGPVPLVSLQEQCAAQDEYLHSSTEHPYKTIVTIARAVATKWRAEQPAVEREKERARRIRQEQEAEQRPLCESIEDAEFWLARDDIDPAFRQELLMRYPQLRAQGAQR